MWHWYNKNFSSCSCPGTQGWESLRFRSRCHRSALGGKNLLTVCQFNTLLEGRREFLRLTHTMCKQLSSEAWEASDKQAHSGQSTWTLVIFLNWNTMVVKGCWWHLDASCNASEEMEDRRYRKWEKADRCEMGLLEDNQDPLKSPPEAMNWIQSHCVSLLVKDYFSFKRWVGTFTKITSSPVSCSSFANSTIIYSKQTIMLWVWGWGLGFQASERTLTQFISHKT